MANLTNLNNKFLVQTGGNVGINTTSPTQKVEITGGYLKFSGGDYGIQGSASLTYNPVSDHYFQSGGSTKVTFKAAGNVGIGSTSPQTKFVVQHTDGGTGIEFSMGASLSYIQCYNRTSSDYIALKIDAEDLRFGTNDGSERMRIDNSGNVGIGTTAPDHILCIEDSEPTLRIFDTDNTLDQEQTIAFGTEPGDRTQAEIASINVNTGNASGALSFKTNSGSSLLERVRITQDGDVGIGTNDPQTNLEISDASQAGLTIRSVSLTGYSLINFADAGDDNVGRIYYGHDDNAMRFRTNDANAMFIDSSQNVGIGTTSPSSYNSRGRNLVISGAGDVGISIDCSSANSGTILFADGTGGTAGYRGIIEYDHSTDSMEFSTAATERMRIDSSGNVGIGTTSPNPFSWGNKHLTCLAAGTNQYFGLDIVGSGSGSGAIIFGGGSGSGTATNIARAQITAVDGSHLVFYTNASNSGSSFTERMRITSAGDVGIGKTNPSTHLDVQGVITCGDSTTDGAIRRQHQTFATMKPGPTSGGNVDMMFVDHTHSLDITVVAYIDASNVATGRGYSVAAYGSATASLSQTQLAGNISALSISYVNTGGSENYILRVTCTYSGVTTPVISVTASGQSTSELRAAT